MSKMTKISSMYKDSISKKRHERIQNIDNVKELLEYKLRKGMIVPEEAVMIEHFWDKLHHSLTNLEATNYYLPHLGSFHFLLSPARDILKHGKNRLASGTLKDENRIVELQSNLDKIETAIIRRENEVTEIKALNKFYEEKYGESEED